VRDLVADGKVLEHPREIVKFISENYDKKRAARYLANFQKFGGSIQL
jgi:hypothetical protein